MIVNNSQQRVAILVDVQNLYYSAKNLYKAKINFKNLLKISLADRILTRAIAYVINADPSKPNEFFEALNSAGFEVKEKELQIFAGGAKKGDWDVGIAMDAVRLGTKVDSIVLVSGDGDYRPVVNYLQQSLGCLVEVVAFKKTANHELIEIADDFINIEEHKEQLLFQEKQYQDKQKGGKKSIVKTKTNVPAKITPSRITPAPSPAKAPSAIQSVKRAE